jgi:CubicO group peptidase (beta-lactamase class C family)
MKKNPALTAYLLLGTLSLLPPSVMRGEDVPSRLPPQDMPAAAAELRTSIPALIKEARIPGLQIALIRDGKIVWHENFGVKNAAAGEPVTDDTIFEAASLTKPFFAYYAMKLVEQGVLELDRPLVSYVPVRFTEEFLGHPLGEKGFHRDWFEKITARQVLSHSSGMPHGESGTPFPLYFEPGTKWKYSADGYFLLQKIIETLKGDKLENLIRNEVLDPLGMSRSSMVWRDDYEKSMANGHGFFGQPEAFRKRTESHAGASLYTTAEDYAKFVCAVMNGEGLRPETLKGMLAPQIEVDKDKGVGWSLGFGTQTDEHGLAIWQWGDYGIFRNYIMAYPGEKSGVVYLTNSFYGLGISSEITVPGVGGQALGTVALNYWPYDAPVYRLGWELADRGREADRELADLAKRLPEAFSKNGVEFLAAIFADAGKQAGTVGLLRYYAKENPRSAWAQFSLATALMQAGDRRQARVLLKKARRADEDKIPLPSIRWNQEYIRALDKPRKLKESYLRKLAGDYGARHLQLKDGRLFYFREGGSSPDYRPLVAMSKDTFVLETMSSFRLKIESDKKGQPVKAVGIYEDGRRDETLRSK